MNMQAHLSGQISGQVSNQIPQQNGNTIQNQMQNFGGGGGSNGGVANQQSFGMDAELFRLRRSMQRKIYTILGSRHPQPMNEAQKIKYNDIVKRLEEGLFKSARTTQEYLDMDTLEQRLQVLIRRPTLNRNQQLQQHISSSSSVGGTMIPTPGMSNNGNSNIMVVSSMNSSVVTASNSMGTNHANSGSLLPTGNGALGAIHNGPFNTSDGSLSNGYQQLPANFSISSGGNHMSSMSRQRMSSQMIPTPGFNGNSDQAYMNMDSSSGGSFSTAQTTMVSQQQLQKQLIGSQNSRVLHNIGNHISSGTRSGMQQKSYAFLNGSVSSGLGTMGNNMQLGNGPPTSEGSMSATHYSNITKPLQQQYEQHQQPHMQGDGYGMNSNDSSGSGNIFGGVTSVGTMMNTQNMSSVNLQSNNKTNSALVNDQSAFPSQQDTSHMNLQLIDHSEKMNFHPSLSSRENVLRSSQQQQFQQRPQFQPQQQFGHQQHQLNPQSRQDQVMVKNEPFGQTQLASNFGSQLKRESGIEHPGAVLHQQVSQQLQHPEFQNQFSGNDYSSGSQFLSTQSAQRNICSTSQSSLHIKQLQPQQVASASLSDPSSVPAGGQAESIIQNQWHSQSLERTQVLGNGTQEQHVKEDFHQRICGEDEAQPNKLSFGGLMSNQAAGPRGAADPPSSDGTISRYGNANRDQHFLNQRRWLLFLRHARSCKAAEGQCPEINCVKAQNLLKHIDTCKAVRCVYPKCQHTKELLLHHKSCRDPGCPVCVPVRQFCMKMKARGRADAGESSRKAISESKEDIQRSLKRVKLEQRSPSPVVEEEKSVSISGTCESKGSQGVHQQDNRHGEMSVQTKSDVSEVKLEVPVSSSQGNIYDSEMEHNADDVYKKMPNGEPSRSSEPSRVSKEENVKVDEDSDDSKKENVTLSADNEAGTKSGKPTIKGVSLTELFTPEQVREHIRGLRQWVGQSKSKAEKHQAMEHSMSENSCQLCAVEKLTFEPPPIYCTPCGARIKRNAMYYTGGTGDTRHYFCIPCYNESRGDSIAVDGVAMPKGRLEKKKNDEETEEWWVQCDKCEAWQHQICALFNGRRNDGGQAEYTCPNCYIEEVERGERKPLPQSAVLGAKDLPKTYLSDHIEQRLHRRLKQEREERAKFQGKIISEVPSAEALVVRVVSSVDKKLEVKPRFLELFREQNYPIEFPYKSKVVLLFQKIEGVEVCLFGMYVQEFGTESALPNQRRVYLSYLDSVKYFRPDVRTVTGEALRTFVYHEILIGYLEYCKKRGFTSCYIWACPPLKGEDYILYCHPEIQKTPKSDKLREWYLSMLRKASKEEIVVDMTNLYEHFFVQVGECKAKVTAARLPYFDGDYWPGAAEDLIYQMQQEEDGRKFNKKGSTKKIITKRALKASGQSDLSGNASKDLLLMHKLGETISPMKEDFIMVHLQHCCSHCCTLMVSGTRWVCQQCKNFQLCPKCYDAEQNLEDRERHPVHHRDTHSFNPIEINDVPADTKDKDDILESEFFDTRQAFLSLCQGNHYQYDTLRRAKHSSMMVLYHLHNPTAPAFVTTCNVCHLDIETGQGWRCEVCPEYDICNACYQKDGGVDHPHKLTNHPSVADRDAQNKEARQLRVQQLRKMLDLLVHASQCRSPQCQYPNCRKVKGLFRHGIQCRTRASGGCGLCKKMWYLLQLHARACKESECHVPRCRDLKEHLRRLQQQSDSRRRAAVNEMMRQRAAEVANNAG